MTIISNSFAPACRQLLPKYTISTLYSANIADNQDSYGYLYEIFQFFQRYYALCEIHQQAGSNSVLVGGIFQ